VPIVFISATGQTIIRSTAQTTFQHCTFQVINAQCTYCASLHVKTIPACKCTFGSHVYIDVTFIPDYYFCNACKWRRVLLL